MLNLAGRPLKSQVEKKIKIASYLENKATANALQLEAARAMPFPALITTPSLKSPNLSLVVLWRFAADTLLYAVT